MSANPYPKPNLVYDGVLNIPGASSLGSSPAPSPAPLITIKKQDGEEIVAETEKEPNGNMVVKNRPVLSIG